MIKPIRVLGFDPSMSNWGIAVGNLHEDMTLDITHLDVARPEKDMGKQVRQNSKDLGAAKQLAEKALVYTKDAQAIFVEVPIGSQSARAMASYGICIGVLGALRAMGIPFFEVTPTEVKLAGFGVKTASKKDMIQWAMAKYPRINWPTYIENGQAKISEAKAEHMADAIAAIHAGIASNHFQQILPFIQVGKS